MRSIREGLRAEHAMIDDLLGRVIAAGEPLDPALWQAFVAAVTAQMAAEEVELVSRLPYARNVRILNHEHRYVRNRVRELGELGEAAGDPAARLRALRDLRDILRAHAKNEEKLLHDWADRELDEERRAVVLEGVCERIARTPPK